MFESRINGRQPGGVGYRPGVRKFPEWVTRSIRPFQCLQSAALTAAIDTGHGNASWQIDGVHRSFAGQPP